VRVIGLFVDPVNLTSSGRITVDSAISALGVSGDGSVVVLTESGLLSIIPGYHAATVHSNLDIPKRAGGASRLTAEWLPAFYMITRLRRGPVMPTRMSDSLVAFPDCR
jgi:hypothetical protein